MSWTQSSAARSPRSVEIAGPGKTRRRTAASAASGPNTQNGDFGISTTPQAPIPVSATGRLTGSGADCRSRSVMAMPYAIMASPAVAYQNPTPRRSASAGSASMEATTPPSTTLRTAAP